MGNFFSHDSNARNSDKLIPLRAKMGAEGYGIYFMILERLREEPDYTSVKDYNMLAFDLRVDAAKVKAVVELFGLFSFTDDGKRFYSEGFLKRMQIKDEKSEKAREAARKRWGNRDGSIADGLRSECERNANAMQTKAETDAIKEKESKGKNNTPPLSPLGGNEDDKPICRSSPSVSVGKRKSCAKKKKPLDLSFVEPAFQPIMADWLAYKSERGQTYRQQGARTCYARLMTLSDKNPQLARRIIDQSMANNWAGFFNLKTNAHDTATADRRTIPHQPVYRSDDDF